GVVAVARLGEEVLDVALVDEKFAVARAAADAGHRRLAAAAAPPGAECPSGPAVHVLDVARGGRLRGRLDGHAGRPAAVHLIARLAPPPRSGVLCHRCALALVSIPGAFRIVVEGRRPPIRRPAAPGAAGPGADAPR